MVSTAADLFNLYQRYREGNQGPSDVARFTGPDTSWELVAGLYPEYPGYDYYHNNRRTVSTGDRQVISKTSGWNQMLYISGYGWSFSTWGRVEANASNWYARPIGRWRKQVVTQPEFPLQVDGIPSRQISVVPDPAPGFVPGAIQMPGAETGSPTVPVHLIRTWNQMRDWMTPQNERHNGVNTRPVTWPAIQIVVTPGQGVRIEPAPAHRNEPPPPGQPERKSSLGRSFQPLVRFIGETAARRTVRSINAVTEANDWLNAFWFALPADVRNPAARLPHQKAADLLQNWNYLDVQQLAMNIAFMEAQDRALGQLSSSAVRRLRAAPGSQQRGFEFFGSFI